MKFIIDHNLPPRLAGLLQDRFPGTVHTMDLGFDRMPDAELWQHARANRFHLMTKDSDLTQLSLLHGAPPKVVWIRIGNAPAHAVADLLERHLEDFERFLHDGAAAILALGR